MRTPAGTECPYYYEDFFRGRSVQECRLIARDAQRDPGPEQWRPSLCGRCEVPAILRANACSHMVLGARVARRWLGLTRRVVVYAVCTEHQVEVKNPYAGCGDCRPRTPTILNADVVEEE